MPLVFSMFKLTEQLSNFWTSATQKTLSKPRHHFLWNPQIHKKYYKSLPSIPILKPEEFMQDWGFHGGDYEEWCLLACYAMWLL
jgi:hypothetical protein